MIVITGGTGFIGREIVGRLRAAGQAVRVVVREPAAAQAFADQFGVELWHGNVLHGPALAGAFDGAKAVIHLVGIINEWKENTFARVHTEATVNVLAAAKAAGIKRYLHMSALGTRPGAVSRYHQTKWAAEEAVRQSGLAWTIFRPSLVYGRGDRSINLLLKIVRRAPVIPVLGDGRGKIQPVAVEAVAGAFVGALWNDATIGKVYDLCGPEAFSWNELYDQLMAQAGVHKPKLHLPLPLARLQAAVLEKTGPYPPLTREQVIMAGEDNTGNPGPAERDLMIPRESFAAGLRRYGA